MVFVVKIKLLVIKVFTPGWCHDMVQAEASVMHADTGVHRYARTSAHTHTGVHKHKSTR